jgi:Holliday junction resolvase
VVGEGGVSRMQRDKGARGEREVFGLLSDMLGTIVRRNVDQARQGGADGIEIPGWAIEVKRWEREELGVWWLQCLDQARKANREPALIWRASRQPWRVMVDLYAINSIAFPVTQRHTAVISLDAFAQLVRERPVVCLGAVA